MSFLDKKIQLFETISGKKSRWLSAWSKVILIILIVLNGIGFLPSLFTIAIDPIGFLTSAVNLGLIIFLFVVSKKADSSAYYGNLALAGFHILSQIISYAMIDFEQFADEFEKGFNMGVSGSSVEGFDIADMSEIFMSVFKATLIISVLIAVVIATLHIVYIVKRKKLFFSTVEQLEAECGGEKIPVYPQQTPFAQEERNYQPQATDTTDIQE